MKMKNFPSKVIGILALMSFSCFAFAQSSGMEKVGPQIEGSFFQGFGDTAGGPISNFAKINNQIFFKGADDAFDMYLGAWAGMQRVAIYGSDKVLVDAHVTQRNVPSDYGNMRRMVGSGRVLADGQSLEIRSTMHIEGEFLVTEIQDEHEGRVKYRGRVNFNTVFWEPYCLVLLCDFQMDAFYLIPNGVLMDSQGLKKANLPQFQGFFLMTSSLTKMESSFAPGSVKGTQEMRFDGLFK